MPKGRKELYALKPSGSISTIQTTGSLCFYLCSPLLLFLTLCYIQSTVLQTLSAAVKLCPIPHLPIHWIPTHIVHNPLFLPVQLFMGSYWKLKTVECFSLKKKKKCFVFCFSLLLLFFPEDTFCCFYRGVVQTAAAQCKDREPVLRASFLWMGSMWKLAEYSSCLSNSVKDHHVRSNACFSLV